MRVIIMKSRP